MIRVWRRRRVVRIPDPFVSLYGGPAHALDLAVAEAITGVPGRSVSRHLVQPAVRAGASPENAIAVLHWRLLGAGVRLRRWWRNRR